MIVMSLLPRILVAGYLDGVLIRIVDVDRLDRADGASPRTWPHANRHATPFQMCHDLGDGLAGDETNMRRHPLVATHWSCFVGSIQMDLLLAEVQGCAVF